MQYGGDVTTSDIELSGIASRSFLQSPWKKDAEPPRSSILPQAAEARLYSIAFSFENRA